MTAHSQTPAGDHWYVVKEGKVVGRESHLDLALLSCLGMEADGVTDNLEGFNMYGLAHPAVIDRADCQATYDSWNEPQTVSKVGPRG